MCFQSTSAVEKLIEEVDQCMADEKTEPTQPAAREQLALATLHALPTFKVFMK